jgi:dUTP pyrophosphatase
MKVRIKKLNENAVVPFKTYDKDFCYDVVATSVEEVAPNVYKYGIGLAFEIDRSGEIMPDIINAAIDFRPRSSVWKTGMILSNCQGTIDELYRGEVCAVFYHIMTNMPKYEVGDRIGQIKLGYAEKIQFEEVDELSTTERGDGGYGSTGK